MTIAKVEPLTSARALRGPFDYRMPPKMDIRVGSVLRIPFGRQRLLGVVTGLADQTEIPADKLAEPFEVIDASIPAELVALGLWVAEEYCSTRSRGLQLVLPPGTMGRLKRDGTIRQRRLGGDGAAPSGPARSARRFLGNSSGDHPVPAHTLTDAQSAAVSTLFELIESGQQKELLLHGVTGSGKTEVYLAATAAALALGKGAIVLVPEIGLTPQAVERFRARFGDRVALLHSGMAEGARHEQWRRLQDGEAQVAVGPRSAVFAPVRNLGLIVIDEEHDSSYKQESDPRYDARAVAARRAEQAGAVLLAGSATPRPESWERLERVGLPDRVDGLPMPEVEVVDMRGFDGGPIHTRTAAELARVRGEGAKAIVMLNRRGFAPHLSCRSCGRAWGCPNCDVSLVLHRSSKRLRCHHCGHAESLPDACPDCGSTTLTRRGVGTERLESMVRELLDPLPVFRLDADAASRRGAHERILREFDEAPAGVLLGTQMVAKGHDFPEVVLSVILDADATLRFPDFRAEERTFALVAQLAGRSGRGEAGGRVLVQTLEPEASSIAAAARHDSGGFLEAELERRRTLGYPPFAQLVRIGLAAADEEAVERAGEGLRALIEPLPPGAQLLGPAPLFKVSGKHRRQILVKTTEPKALTTIRDGVAEATGSGRMRGVTLSVDVDPQ